MLFVHALDHAQAHHLALRVALQAAKVGLTSAVCRPSLAISCTVVVLLVLVVIGKSEFTFEQDVVILHPLLLYALHSYFADIGSPGTLDRDDLLHDASPAVLL